MLVNLARGAPLAARRARLGAHRADGLSDLRRELRLPVLGRATDHLRPVRGAPGDDPGLRAGVRALLRSRRTADADEGRRRGAGAGRGGGDFFRRVAPRGHGGVVGQRGGGVGRGGDGLRQRADQGAGRPSRPGGAVRRADDFRLGAAAAGGFCARGRAVAFPLDGAGGVRVVLPRVDGQFAGVLPDVLAGAAHGDHADHAHLAGDARGGGGHRRAGARRDAFPARRARGRVRAAGVGPGDLPARRAGGGPRSARRRGAGKRGGLTHGPRTRSGPPSRKISARAANSARPSRSGTRARKSSRWPTAGATARKPCPGTDDTLVLMWSITKALASACLLHVLAADGIALETPVAALWPEFAANGKGAVTLAQLLSHQAGLAAMDAPQTSVLDHAAVAAALAAQAPNWPPGTAHGYHPRTFGFLVDELLRRLRPGQTVGTYWRETFAEPLGLDIWIGLPDEQTARVAHDLRRATIGRAGARPARFTMRWATKPRSRAAPSPVRRAARGRLDEHARGAARVDPVVQRHRLGAGAGEILRHARQRRRARRPDVFPAARAPLDDRTR